MIKIDGRRSYPTIWKKPASAKSPQAVRHAFPDHGGDGGSTSYCSSYYSKITEEDRKAAVSDSEAYGGKCKNCLRSMNPNVTIRL